MGDPYRKEEERSRPPFGSPGVEQMHARGGAVQHSGVLITKTIIQRCASSARNERISCLL